MTRKAGEDLGQKQATTLLSTPLHKILSSKNRDPNSAAMMTASKKTAHSLRDLRDASSQHGTLKQEKVPP